MSDDTELDKHEEATPYKKQKAREKGSVAKSAEVMAAASVAVAALACFALAGRAITRLGSLQQHLLSVPPGDVVDVAAASQLMGQVLMGGLTVLGPLLFLVVCVSILANLAQTGPVWSTEPITPDPQRLNPVNGLKRLFSMRSVFDLGKSIVKLCLLGGVLWLALCAAVPSLLSLLQLDPRGYLPAFAGLTGTFLVKLLLALVAIAAVDWLFSRSQHARKLRMSVREIKDEVKQREGDPRIRSRMRDLRRQVLQKSKSLRNVKDADVVVTNPTRVAVAIRYRHGEEAAPRVVAKGAGEMARRIRDLAGRHRVAVVHSPRLARALYRHTECEQFVPGEWFPLLARILVWTAAQKAARCQAFAGDAR